MNNFANRLIKDFQRYVPENINPDIFTKNGDFIDRDENVNPDENQLKMIMIDSATFEMKKLIDLENKEDCDEKLINYRDQLRKALNNLGSRLYEPGSKYTFDLVEKFMWIHIHLACFYNSDVLAHLSGSNYFNANTITTNTTFGLSPLIVSCFAEEGKQLNHFKNILKAAMFEVPIKVRGRNEFYPLIIQMVSRTDTFKYIMTHVGDIHFSIFKQYKDNMTPFLVACYNNPDVARIILNSEHMTQAHFNTCGTGGLSPLLIATEFQPSLLKDLLESKHCTPELVHRENNIFFLKTIECNNDNNAIITLLESKYLENYSLSPHTINLFTKKVYSNEIMTFIIKLYGSKQFFEQIDKKTGLNVFTTLVVSYPYILNIVLTQMEEMGMTKEIFTTRFENSIPMFFHIIEKTTDEKFIDGLLKLKYFDQETFDLTTTNTNATLLQYLSYYNTTALMIVLNSKYINKINLNAQDNKKNTILSLLIKHTVVTDNQFLQVIHNKLLDKDLINHIGTNNKTLLHNCIKNKRKNILYELFVNKNLSKATFNMPPHIYSETQDEEMKMKILSHQLFSSSNFLKHIEDAMKNKQCSLLHDLLNHTLCDNKTFIASVVYVIRQGGNIFVNTDIIKRMTNILINSIHFTPYMMLITYQHVSFFQHTITHDCYNLAYTTTPLLELTDSNKNNMLTRAYLYGSTQTVHDMINSKHMTKSIVEHKNKDGKNLLHTIIAKFTDISYKMTDTQKNKIEIIFKSKHIDDSLIQTSNLMQFTMHLNKNILDIILNKDSITSQSLLKQNEFKMTILHNLYNVPNTKSKNDIFQKIIQSPKCSRDLLELQDINGNTFLMLNLDLLQATIDSEYCTGHLLHSANKVGENILTKFVQGGFNYAKMGVVILLTNNIITSKIFRHTELSNPLTESLMDSSGNCLEQFLQSNKLKPEHLNNKIFTNSLTEGNVSHIKILLKSKFDLTYLFNNIDKKCLLTYEVFTLFMKSKYFDDNYFKTNSKYIIQHIFNSNDNNLMECFIDSKYFKEILKYESDLPVLFLFVNKPVNLRNMLKSKYFTKHILQQTNKRGMNSFHYFAITNSDSLKLLMESKECDNTIINSQDNTGNTPFHYACELNYDSAILIKKSEYFTTELLLIQNNKKQNPLMISIKNNMMLDIIVSNKLTKEVFQQVNSNGNNILMYCTRYLKPKSVKYIIDFLVEQGWMKELLMMRNYNGETCIMYACKYDNDFDGESATHLLKLDCCTLDLLSSGYIGNRLSCLALATQHNSNQLIQNIIEWDKMTMNFICIKHNNKNILELGCRYNTHLVKCLIKSKYDITQLFTNNTTTTVQTAAKYQPDAFIAIMESKYATEHMLSYINSNNESCTNIALECQPLVLKWIIESKYCSDKILSLTHREQVDENGDPNGSYSKDLYHTLRNNNQNQVRFREIGDIKNIKLCNMSNIESKDESNNDTCTICEVFKKNVFFDPCGHTICGGCAIKLNECPWCKSRISHKKVMY